MGEITNGQMDTPSVVNWAKQNHTLKKKNLEMSVFTNMYLH